MTYKYEHSVINAHRYALKHKITHNSHIKYYIHRSHDTHMTEEWVRSSLQGTVLQLAMRVDC